MTVFEYHHTGNSEAQQKAALSYLMNQVSTGKAATGVVKGLAVTQTPTATASVMVGAGAGTVQASVVAGASFMVNDTDTNYDVLLANPVGALPRNDIIVVDAGTTSLRTIVGTPNATPSDPTYPASSMPLARLRHAGSAITVPTSKIDDLRTYTGLLGYFSSGWIIEPTPSGWSGTVASMREGNWATITFGLVRTGGALTNADLTGFINPLRFPASRVLIGTAHFYNAASINSARIDIGGGLTVKAVTIGTGGTLNATVVYPTI